MASSSSSNKTSTAAGLTNNYFFYGTHPVIVPNHVSHSNSIDNISSTSDQNTHHLSLPLKGNHNGYASASELSTTQSLHNMVQSHTDNDETSEVMISFLLANNF